MIKRIRQGWQAPRVRRLQTAGLVLIAAASSIGAEGPGDNPHAPPTWSRPPAVAKQEPPDAAGETQASLAASEAAAGQVNVSADHLAALRTALNPLLVRDRRHLLLLLRGDGALENGQSQAGMAHLQALLDAPQDAFFWSAHSAQPQGAQSEVIRRFQDLPASARACYERQYGPSARELLERYLESHEESLLSELCRRFRHTAAAREQAVRELLIARDYGRSARAGEWARLLLADGYQWDQLSPALRRLVEQIGAASDPITENTGVATSKTKTMRGGRAAGISPSNAEPSPPFPVPVWTSRFDAGVPAPQSAEVVNEFIRDAHAQWLADRLERRLPISTTNEAIVAGEFVVVRDYSQLRALDVATGEVRWTYPCTASLAAEAARRLAASASSTRVGPSEFDSLFAANAVLGRLSTDGSRVYLLDQAACCESDARSGLTRADGSTAASAASGSPHPNQLVALPIRPVREQRAPLSDGPLTSAPLWTRGAQSNLPNDELAGQIFLGAPLCIDDRVFVMAEADLQLSVVALDAATGHTLWIQTVGLANRPIETEMLRARTACSPLYAEGTLVCPTEVGVVVGVDALTGSLRWAYDHLEEDQRSAAGRWTLGTGRSADRLSLSGRAYLQRGRCIMLPQRSDALHCIDVASGARLWTAPRLEAQAIGGVTDNEVLLLGDRDCRALDPHTGETLWRTITPEPAGLGIVAGSRFLLPTCEGSCLSIRLGDGRIEGRQFSRLLKEIAQPLGDGRLFAASPGGDAFNHETAELLATLEKGPCGTLLAARDVMIVATPQGVSVFPQALPALERLQSSAHQSIAAEHDDFKESQLLVMLGQLAEARSTLERMLSTTTSDQVRDPAEQLLSEILYAQLDESDAPVAILSRIEQLVHSDVERRRLLLENIDVAVGIQDVELLISAVDQLSSLPLDGLTPMDGESYHASVGQCVWQRLCDLREHGPAGLREALAAHILDRAALVEQSEDAERLMPFLALFAGWQGAAPPRDRLARQWMASGRRQAAELLLLSNRFSDESRVRGEGRPLLSELYVLSGLASSAPQPSSAASIDRATVPKPNAAAIQDDAVSLLATATVALRPLAHPVSRKRIADAPPSVMLHVQISEHHRDDERIDGEARRFAGLLETARRRFVPKPSGKLMVLDRKSVDDEQPQSRLVIVDRDSGAVRGEVDVPADYWQMPPPLIAETGHMMVIGGESVFGVSLLEGKLLWTVQPQSRGKKAEKVKIGPVGSDYCVLQTSRELRVVHPATGDALWLRKDLPPGVGLLENDATGIIGDCRTLTVFDPDQIGYTVLQMQSGGEVRRGARSQASDVNRRQRWAVGRRLVEVVSNAEGSQLQVWDSREDELEFDIPLKDRLVAPLANELDFAFITREGRLQFLNVAAGDVYLDLPVLELVSGEAAADNPSDARSLVVFSDADRWFVNLVNEGAVGDAGSTAATDNLAFPNVRVCGRLLAIDRVQHEIVWRRQIADACIPLRPEATSPMLLLVRRSRDDTARRERGKQDDAPRLMIEVLDASSGLTLAHRDDLDAAQFFDCSLVSRAGSEGQAPETRMSLIGANSRVDVALAPQPGGLRTASEAGLTVER